MKNQTREVIQALWIGKTLSVMERLSISSFLTHGHEYHLYVYEDIQDLPKGIIVKNANEIIPSDRIFKYPQHESFSGFSNLFRYKLLLERGGYWADTDVVCLRRFDFSKHYVFAEEEITETEKRICGNIIKTPPGSEIMKFCYETSIAKNPDLLNWGETGPDLLTPAVEKFSLSSNVCSYWTFNPVNWWHWEDFVQDGLAARLRLRWRLLRRPHGIHLWNEMWRRNGAGKNQRYPSKSLYERLKRKYL
jgi:Mannosyltransferase OCH1 and related enzymes